MTFRPASVARAYIGPLAAHAYARTVQVNGTLAMLDTTCLPDTAKVFIPDDDTSTFSVGGPLDTSGAVTGQFAAITALKAASTPTPITFLPLGLDGAAWLFNGIETAIDTTAARGQTVDWSFGAQTTGETDMQGQVLENNTTVTVDGNGTAVDGLAATANGAVFHCHTTAFSGLTSNVVTIEDSANGSSGWATIATFTTITAIGAERIAITGAVRRYLRVVDNVTGTGSTTRFVVCSRR